ncbi:hypothetical protein ACOMHN_038494 [Nucella lapillus]
MAAATDSSGKKHKHEKKTFTCSLCSHEMEYHYHGNKPPFAKSLMLLEECYIMKDPFSTSGGLITVGATCCVLLEECYIMKDPFSTSGGLITVGATCCACHSVVCLASNCSLFYAKRFCIPCVLQHIAEFPEEIQEEVAKQQKEGNAS